MSRNTFCTYGKKTRSSSLKSILSHYILHFLLLYRKKNAFNLLVPYTRMNEDVFEEIGVGFCNILSVDEILFFWSRLKAAVFEPRLWKLPIFKSRFQLNLGARSNLLWARHNTFQVRCDNFPL
ncbi:hypothetical protein ACKWTF_000184 [Chironomus riparius]